MAPQHCADADCTTPNRPNTTPTSGATRRILMIGASSIGTGKAKAAPRKQAKSTLVLASLPGAGPFRQRCGFGSRVRADASCTPVVVLARRLRAAGVGPETRRALPTYLSTNTRVGHRSLSTAVSPAQHPFALLRFLPGLRLFHLRRRYG